MTGFHENANLTREQNETYAARQWGDAFLSPRTVVQQSEGPSVELPESHPLYVRMVVVP